jgi:hypothetical protein
MKFRNLISTDQVTVTYVAITSPLQSDLFAFPKRKLETDENEGNCEGNFPHIDFLKKRSQASIFTLKC